ncbi:MAG: 16S rRNA (cytidine(1402)-2'-O)-methyltransferase [Candidatus Kapaibacteriales bacterium]
MTQDNKEKTNRGILYIISTPIGNDDDITIRALMVLRSVDIVVCEDPKVGARVLHKYNLLQKMELLNEQNELKKTPEIVQLLEQGKNIALICDGGTPVFADPGLPLVQTCLKKDIPIKVIPGVTSLMTALVRSGFSLNQFLYAGFLSRKKEERLLQIRRLSNENRTVVLFETPYRLLPLLEDAAKIMPDRRAYIGCNLTMPYETHHYGTFKELYERLKDKHFKGEFVVCFDSANFTDQTVKSEFLTTSKPQSKNIKKKFFPKVDKKISKPLGKKFKKSSKPDWRKTKQ